MSEFTFIGLDVHARSVSAGVLDGATGEVRSCAAPARSAELVAWLGGQGGALTVAYEAGPTGFGLARACEAARIPCLVAAPSRIPRAAADRVKTDRRDALKSGQAAAPWRACRHTGAQRGRGGRPRPGAGPRGRALRPDARPPPGLQTAAASRPALGGTGVDASPRTLAGRAVLRGASVAARLRGVPGGDRLGAGPPRRPRCGHHRGGGQGALGRRRGPAVLPARRLGADRLRPGGGDRRLAALRRALDRRLPGARAPRELLG